ncbi:MAG: citrate synthase [Erysipelotrichaceae bacterium]|nr:citrate synthase [Erysipelotrichaceae bacterium]
MIYPDVPAFSAEEIAILCDAYRENNFIDPKVSEKLGVKRGLRNPDGTGVLAGLTNICDVVGYDKKPDGTIVPIDGKLIYRGIDLQTLVNEAIENDRFMFEEVVWLLLFGSLPTRDNLRRFCTLLERHRELPDGFAEKIIISTPSPNIMNKMARAVLSMYSYDENAENSTLENIIRQSINLIAELPTMMVYSYQTKKHAYDHGSLYFHYPMDGLSTAEHILSTYRPDQSYTHEEAKLLDLCMIVHADHGGGNNSTFVDRVLSSSGTDTYSAISGAICSLKGPKHGGANLMVMHQLDDMLEHIKDTEDETEVKEYLRKIMRREAGNHSGLIYGIGHAVYTKSDPRAQILKKYSKDLAYEKGFRREYDLLCLIEKLGPEVFMEEKGLSKRICANMDLYSGLVYRILGISEDLFTPIFAISRVAGWCAHRMEEVEFANRIIRPAYRYIGHDQDYVAIDDREED